MKVKSVLFAGSVMLSSFAFSAAPDSGSMHYHPKADTSPKMTQSNDEDTCYVGISNESNEDITVTGTFDDGVAIGFSIYGFDRRLHKIYLDYGMRCHEGMHINIQRNYGGYTVFSDWVPYYHIVTVHPFYANSIKANTKNAAEVTVTAVSK